MAKVDLISNDWIDLVFEGKNQEYGAYKLRKNTTKRNIYSVLFVLVAAALAILGPALYKMAVPEKKVEQTQVTELSRLKEAKVKQKPKEEKKVVKIEEVKPIERVKSSVKFVAPVIKKDNEVKPEEELKTQDQMNESKLAIGALDVKGNDEKGGEVMELKQNVVQPEKPKDETENKVFDVVEQMPSFPGGQGALMQYLSSNIKYPVVAEENGIQGRVIIQFVVEKDGSVTDVHVAKSVDPSLDKEAVRVVKSMPKWIPGKQNGAPVRVKYTVPVTFRLQ